MGFEETVYVNGLQQRMKMNVLLPVIEIKVNPNLSALKGKQTEPKVG